MNQTQALRLDVHKLFKSRVVALHHVAAVLSPALHVGCHVSEERGLLATRCCRATMKLVSARGVTEAAAR